MNRSSDLFVVAGALSLKYGLTLAAPQRPKNLCPISLPALCTRSKNCVKTVLRHIWKDYEELADDARYTPEYKDLYAKRNDFLCCLIVF